MSRLIDSIPVRIQGGPNAGLRWSLASSGRGYRRGSFEKSRVDTFTALLASGDVVWDIGAHKGYLSLAAARIVGARGSVVAFEPSSENRALLERHLEWNSARNVRVVPVAVSGSDGEARFGGKGSTITFRIGVGDETVATRTVRTLIERDALPAPTVLKIDAEGAEVDILRGAGDHLRAIGLVFISVHGRELYHECDSILTAAGFRVFPSSAAAARLRDSQAPWGGDKELLAVSSGRGLAASAVQALPLFAA
ncbi:MAG: FkbM family methyltransferase [Gemmatimonadetes bacterium]|nr:FkbM family methyltransferase [Gemmatimonadota bacterium]